jgi:hypothetical protein
MASTLRGRLDRTFKQLIFEAIAGIAAIIALFFFSLAAYGSVRASYGAVVAALVLGGAYAALALAALIWLFIWLRLSRQQEEATQGAAGAAQLLQDPLVVSTGLEILRAVGFRRASTLGAVLLAGVLIATSKRNPKFNPSQSGSKGGSAR